MKIRLGRGVLTSVALALSLCGVTLADAVDSAPVVGQALTGTIAVSTRYLSRGIDLSEGAPVPQAGFEYVVPRGAYVDGYAAKIRYFGMDTEIDTSTGYRGKWKQLNYDLGVYYYYYPGAAPALHSSYGELGAKFAWGNNLLVPVLELYVSNNYFFGAGKSLFVWSGADIALPAAITGSARFGYLTVKDNRAFIYPDYSTWMLSAAKDFAGLNWSLQLTDTSMTRSECTNESRCSVKLTVKLAKSF